MRAHRPAARSLPDFPGQIRRVVLESHALRYLTDQHMKRSMVHLQAKPLENDSLDHALTLARTLRELPFDSTYGKRKTSGTTS